MPNVEVVLTGLFATFGLLFNLTQRSLARKQRTADLYDQFYSANHYHSVVGPVFSLMVRWNGLEADRRCELARAMCKGWADPRHASRLLEAYRPETGETETSEEFLHFKHGRSVEEITEHSALTSFLYFWVKLDGMRRAGLLYEGTPWQRGLVHELFRPAYSIYADFIAEFREAVVSCEEIGDVQPAWFQATRRLERAFFGEVRMPSRPVVWDQPEG